MTKMKNFILENVSGIADELVQVRRCLHRIPEIGDELPKTKAFVCDYLDKIGVSYRLCQEGDGVIAEIQGRPGNKTIAFRADMDALHNEEQTDIPFRSQHPGNMHGCGHDVHTAILLLTAKQLASQRDCFAGKVRFLFQTGEETGSGAKKMIASGGIEGVDAIFALHVGNLAGDSLEAGDFAILPGFASAGKMKFTITVKGKGTHSAFPERGIDPIPVAARIINGCEELMARELAVGTAAVVSFGCVHAGEDHNTIPETATIKGSVRCQDAKIREFLARRVEEISVHTAKAYRAEGLVEIKRGSESVYNDEQTAALAAEAVAAVYGRDSVHEKLPAPLMGSDDFANYAQRMPAVYFMLHTNNKQKGIVEANHSPRFDVDEDVLQRGVGAYMAIALRILNEQ